MSEEKKQIDKNIKQLFENIIKRYKKGNTIQIGMLKDGTTIMYKRIKLIDKEIEFMEDYLKE